MAGGDDGQLGAVDGETLEPWAGEAMKHPGKEDVRDVAFSPDGAYCAVACGQAVVLYDGNSLERLHKCEGHSGAVAHLDWAADGSVLRSTDSAYEILFWDPANHKKARHPAPALCSRSFSPCIACTPTT